MDPADDLELPSWLPGRAPMGRPASARTLRARGEDMTQRLLDAGREAFWTRGYDAARVDDIVELAGASHGTFYLYFRNKEDLLHRLAIPCADDLRARSAALEELTPPPTFAELSAWIDGFVDAYRANGPVLRVWLERRDVDPLMQALANEVLGRLAEALGRLVDPALAEALGPGIVRLGLLTMLERFTAYYEAGHGDLDRAEVVATETRLLLGLTVPPGSPAAALAAPARPRRRG